MAVTLRRLGRMLGVVAAVAAVTLTSAAAVNAAPAPSASDVDPLIVGGSRATIGQHLYTVYLASGASGSGQFCGGTLVAANKVVTAAHCTKGRSPASTFVVHGREDKQSTAGTVAKVTKIWVHPSYTSATAGFDVSVLTLDRNISGPTVPLATPADTALYAAGQSALILGWGTTSSGGSASRYLLKANVPVTSDQTCKTAYPQYSNTSMVCAGLPQGGIDTCQGDSGGPMIVGGKLIGATSWGRGCAMANYPGVYARIAPYHAVLTQQITS
ncbi:S1 family peptidase [Crossiella cryophila]|uniref:Secreted trypsin-like serine protease n=1 Tax=Crossiella cryophila TaxID=43355 RepID=A0A7W7FY34_9PSEU|nr:serine protease [Crossiella cryophila]MBB4681952.1 secreted trypsin-like serine protease [Crossiella cryophila]